MNTKERMARALWLASLSDCSKDRWEKQSIWYKDRFFERAEAVLDVLRDIEETEENAALLPSFRTMIDLILEGK